MVAPPHAAMTAKTALSGMMEAREFIGYLRVNKRFARAVAGGAPNSQKIV
jgi:hypothetical protein